MSESLLSNMVIVFALAIMSMFICIRLRVPTIVGLLLVGVAAGPSGLGLVDVSVEVEAIADIGVVLLLFTIGLEFSLKKLLGAKRTVLVGVPCRWRLP
jgi:CPA2 family monovalent cation:H+ antiporter-2